MGADAENGYGHIGIFRLKISNQSRLILWAFGCATAHQGWCLMGRKGEQRGWEEVVFYVRAAIICCKKNGP